MTSGWKEVSRKTTERDLDGQTVYGTLAIIIFCAFVLRFYRLGEPTLWYDEMWMALLSTKSLSYLVEQSLYFGRGTPLEPLFFKAASTLGRNDFAIRSLFALSGVGAVFVVFRIGERFFGRTTGVVAACFLALNYAHVALSRIARGYSLLLLFFSLALYFTIRFQDSKRKNDYWLAAFFSLFCANLSFLGILLVFPLYCIFAASLVLEKNSIKSKLARITTHSAVYLAIIAPSLYFLLAELTHGADGSSIGGTGNSTLLESLSSSLVALSALFAGTQATIIVYSMALFGAFFLMRTNKRLLTILSLVAFLPLALSFASGYIFFTTKYIAFLLVPISIFIGVFIETITAPQSLFFKRLTYVSLVIATITASCFFLQKNNTWLYVEDNLETKNIFPVGLYKQVAKHAVRHLDSPFIAFNSNFLSGGVSWYFDQFSETNLASLQHVKSPRDFAKFQYIYVHNDTDTSSLFSALNEHGIPVDIEKSEYCNIANATIPSDHFLLKNHTNSFHVDAFPYSALRYAHELKNITLDHHFGGTLIPASYDDGLMEFWFYNELSAQNYVAYLSLKYKNMAKNGHITVRYALDDDAFVDLFSSKRGRSGDEFIGSIPISRNFNILKIQFKIAADRHTAVGGIENFGLVGIKSFNIHIADSDHADIAYTNLLAATMPQGLFSQAAEDQSLTIRNGLASKEENGAEVISPVSIDKICNVFIALKKGSKTLLFYPRVFGEQDIISVHYVDNDNTERSIFSIRGDGKKWTPMLMSVPLPPLGPNEHISIQLHGGAQLWAKNGKAIFVN